MITNLTVVASLDNLIIKMAQIFEKRIYFVANRKIWILRISNKPVRLVNDYIMA